MTTDPRQYGPCWCNNDGTTHGHRHTKQELATAVVMPPICGKGWTVDTENGHWYITCQQPPDHSGPHVGLISWGDTR